MSSKAYNPNGGWCDGRRHRRRPPTEPTYRYMCTSAIVLPLVRERSGQSHAPKPVRCRLRSLVVVLSMVYTPKGHPNGPTRWAHGPQRSNVAGSPPVQRLTMSPNAPKTFFSARSARGGGEGGGREKGKGKGGEKRGEKREQVIDVRVAPSTAPQRPNGHVTQHVGRSDPNAPTPNVCRFLDGGDGGGDEGNGNVLYRGGRR